jgi:hypothetical protein
MDIDKYTPNDLKKLFTKGTTINFLNDYTFQDVEDGKKKLYMQMNQNDQYQDKPKLKKFLDDAGRKLMEDKISNGFDKPIGAVIKNTVKDNLNPDYKNTIKRLVNIDSQYMPLNAPSSYVFKLTEKLMNVVSIELINLQVPMTFYNIEDRQGNNFFYIYKNSEDPKLIDISDGNYSLETLIPVINSAINDLDYDISFVIDPIDGKTTITKTNTGDTNTYTIEFYEDSMTETTKINHCLGWLLGFHKYTVNDSEVPNLTYTLSASTNSVTSDKVAYIGTTKNIVVVLDEFSQNQTSGTMVQTIQDVNSIKPSLYYANSKDPKNTEFSPLNLDCLSPSNITTDDQMKIALTKTGLTRAQIYTRAQINQNKLLVNQQNNYLEPNVQNNILAIVPFESFMTTTWAHKYFTDKNKYVREYHGPIEIEKMQVRLYDDKGYEMNFNGANWSLTMITEHLYKY